MSAYYQWLLPISGSWLNFFYTLCFLIFSLLCFLKKLIWKYIYKRKCQSLNHVQLFATHELQPIRLLWTRNSLGKNTGVGSLSLLQGISPTQGSNPGLLQWRQILYYLRHQGSPKVKVLVTQSCLILCDPMDCSPSGSSVHGILQARILEWVVISFSRGSSQPRDWTRFFCIAERFFTVWGTREAYKKKVM